MLHRRGRERLDAVDKNHTPARFRDRLVKKPVERGGVRDPGAVDAHIGGVAGQQALVLAVLVHKTRKERLADTHAAAQEDGQAKRRVLNRSLALLDNGAEAQVESHGTREVTVIGDSRRLDEVGERGVLACRELYLKTLLERAAMKITDRPERHLNHKAGANKVVEVLARQTPGDDERLGDVGGGQTGKVVERDGRGEGLEMLENPVPHVDGLLCQAVLCGLVHDFLPPCTRSIRGTQRTEGGAWGNQQPRGEVHHLRGRKQRPLNIQGRRSTLRLDTSLWKGPCAMVQPSISQHRSPKVARIRSFCSVGETARWARSSQKGSSDAARPR